MLGSDLSAVHLTVRGELVEPPVKQAFSLVVLPVFTGIQPCASFLFWEIRGAPFILRGVKCAGDVFASGRTLWGSAERVKVSGCIEFESLYFVEIVSPRRAQSLLRRINSTTITPLRRPNLRAAVARFLSVLH